MSRYQLFINNQWAQVVSRFYILRAGAIAAQATGDDLAKSHTDLAREFYL